MAITRRHRFEHHRAGPAKWNLEEPRWQSSSQIILGLFICLLPVAGCDSARSQSEPGGHEEVHIGHVIPAHKPRSFPQAVSRCRELYDQISGAMAHGNPNPSVDPRLLSIALDIANWLPEIAADSDMPPAPWNEVQARAANLASAYETVRQGSSQLEVEKAIKQANESIIALEALLRSSTSSWFDEPKQPGHEAAPESSARSPSSPADARGS
jgi:hypothetical protein